MEKLTLFKDCDVIVYDGDNELISSCVAKSLFASREIAWSKKDNERPLFIESIQKENMLPLLNTVIWGCRMNLVFLL